MYCTQKQMNCLWADGACWEVLVGEEQGWSGAGRGAGQGLWLRELPGPCRPRPLIVPETSVFKTTKKPAGQLALAEI